MDNAENEEQANNVPEHTSDTEMPNASPPDETVDQSNRTAKPVDNGPTDHVKKAPESIVSAPGSWQIPPGALAASNNTSTPVNPVTYHPPTASSKAAEKIEKVEQRIRDDQYDLDAWTILINEIQNNGNIDAIRDVYERVLKVFPTSVGFLVECGHFSLFFILGIKTMWERNGYCLV
jgi:cleavage stimulation factor subunit 3